MCNYFYLRFDNSKNVITVIVVKMINNASDCFTCFTVRTVQNRFPNHTHTLHIIASIYYAPCSTYYDINPSVILIVFSVSTISNARSPAVVCLPVQLSVLDHVALNFAGGCSNHTTLPQGKLMLMLSFMLMCHFIAFGSNYNICHKKDNYNC